MSDLPTMFEPPPSSDSASALNDYIQPNLGHALRIWWAYYWPTTIITLLSGYLLGLVVRILYQDFIISAKPVLFATRYGGYVINYIVAFFVIRYVLDKTFRHFRLGLLSNSSGDFSQPVNPTLARTLRVWWIFTWRTVLYGLLCFALVLYPMGIFVGIFKPSPLFASLFFLALGAVAGGGIALFVIYSNILDEEIGDFRVVLLPRQAAAAAGDPLAAMPAGIG